MGLRFRKSVKILPGVKLNFSKSGTSVTVGKRGMSANFSSRGTRATVGIPGTGLSYTTYSRKSKQTKTLGNYKSQPQEFGWEVLIPTLGVTLSFILFLDGQVGWGFLGLAVTFLILVPITIQLRVKKDTKELPSINPADAHIVTKQDLLKPEYESRMRIFNNGNQIIQNTVDFDEFERWMTTLLNTINWCHDKYESGNGIAPNMTREQAIADWGICYNDNAVRIAKHISASADTAQKAKNRISKIEQIRSSLKDAPNKRGSGFAIDNLLSKLKSK